MRKHCSYPKVWVCKGGLRGKVKGGLPPEGNPRSVWRFPSDIPQVPRGPVRATGMPRRTATSRTETAGQAEGQTEKQSTYWLW